MDTLHLFTAAQAQQGEGHAVEEFGPGQIEIDYTKFLIHHERRYRQRVEDTGKQIGVVSG
ncbi:MAG TPA: hypothetical protein VMU80_16165 [Bryobacteraceae bacterium]|nr:hypothetical protein [Bryobacteraceae bacterium]